MTIPPAVLDAPSLALGLCALAAAALLAQAARRRWQLSRAKHPSLTGHARIARRLARWVPGYAYDDARFFAADGAPDAVAAQRRAGFERLSVTFAHRFARTLAAVDGAAPGLPDLQFTSAYRVPFQFAPRVRQALRGGGVLQRAGGVTMTDLDGNTFHDLTGSYGVNLLGVDFYRQCIAEGSRRAEALGPVLGAYHPCIGDVVERLRAISGQDAVTFHMSGTEAVMQAVRLARYHTRRTHIVRFCGAYHGWWDDVQPGPGNPARPRDTHTLREMDDRTLRVLRTRSDIACVLVNPLQALHPNSAAPADSSLVDGSRRAGFDRAAYTAWLRQLRQVCTERGIVLIFDEVFMGFRLAPGGAQQYFGVQADLVTYGKTLGGGLPVGVVCGQAALMKRWRDERPADICFARGTFNAHPYVLCAMQVFLERLQSPEIQALYDGLDERWDARAAQLNQRLAAACLPVRVAHLGTVWTVTFTQPGRYHWMLQYHLREQGLALSWVGSGRFIFSLAYTDADFAAVADRFVAAARTMASEGWWWRDEAMTAKAIRRGVLREMLARRLATAG